jgi:hypothetical protein
MYPSSHDDGFAVILAAVRMFPNRWSFEAQLLTLAAAPLLNAGNVEFFLDIAEVLVRAGPRYRYVRLLRSPV